MAVTREEVLRIAALARLALTDEELERMTRELNGILAHADALAELTDAPAAADAEEGGASARADAPTRPAAAPLRADEPGADPLRVPPETMAPDWSDGFFTVPRLAAMGDAQDEA